MQGCADGHAGHKSRNRRTEPQAEFIFSSAASVTFSPRASASARPHEQFAHALRVGLAACSSQATRSAVSRWPMQALQARWQLDSLQDAVQGSMVRGWACWHRV